MVEAHQASSRPFTLSVKLAAYLWDAGTAAPAAEQLVPSHGDVQLSVSMSTLGSSVLIFHFIPCSDMQQRSICHCTVSIAQQAGHNVSLAGPVYMLTAPS